MNKNINRLIVLFVIISTLLMSFPKTVFADGGEGGVEKEVNGYHVKLIFVEPIKVGENQFHIQITDSMGMPVTNAEVKVSAMPAEGMSEHDENEEMAAEVSSTGVMTSNDNMDGMEMAAEDPSTGVMQPNEPAAEEHGEEVLTVMLEPTLESGEYAGELHFDASGEWMFNVHFTVNGETTEVDFPVEIARTLGTNYAILTGFFGINATAIIIAATLKRKSVVIRK